MENYKPCHVDLSVDYAILQADNAALLKEKKRLEQLYEMELKRAIKAEGQDFLNAYDNALLRQRLARLVEAAERFEQVGWTQRGWEDCLQKLSIAIAAVERHLAKSSPPHSSPPPADTGRA